MKKIYKNTPSITAAFYTWNALSKSLGSVVNQSFFEKKLPIEDKVTYIKALADSDYKYWDSVKKAYPELNRSGLNISGDESEVVVNNAELFLIYDHRCHWAFASTTEHHSSQ